MNIGDGKNLFTGSFLLTAAITLAGCTREPAPVETIASELIGERQIYGNGLPAKTVVLTYDDGPDEHTLALAKYLNENGVRATFFINGSRICSSPGPDGTCLTPPQTRRCTDGRSQARVANPRYYPESVLDEILALGHRIGNHTQDHCHLNGQTNAADLAFEFQATQEIIDRHVCDGVLMFRAPYGEWNAATARRVNAPMALDRLTGPINWDIDGEDWECWQKGTSPESCANRYMNILNGRPNQNGIFLMHDRPEFNVGASSPLDMARILVPRLKAAGYRFGSMDDVLKITPKDAGACQPPVIARDAAAEGGAPTDALAPTTDVPGTGGSPGASGTGGSGASGSGGAPAVGTGGAPIATGGAPAAGQGGRSGTGGSSPPPLGPALTSGEGGGCSYGPSPGTPAVPAAFALLGLALLVRRRLKE